eukprot:CAMPEP_0203899424 /NCGR_PEP_ID=MMETSP0359-20131031/41846_1 /ASSEMBLY_ACC=CAM_ASM_000338 /TAXON_ID=268821 /ORGANISM="Scrippsiella Hangoei, Strain SHTV-5" /LENGTH=141 /DNA_ID=CAMNT_0050822671 /DNA_START=144 /DNA_END=567 /DNA_ORIENTATION=-
MCLQHLQCATSSFPAFECQNPDAHALQHLLRLRLWDFWQKLLLMVQSFVTVAIKVKGPSFSCTRLASISSAVTGVVQTWPQPFEQQSLLSEAQSACLEHSSTQMPIRPLKTSGHWPALSATIVSNAKTNVPATMADAWLQD